MPNNENGRYHVLVHDPPAGLGGCGLAGASDDRAEAIEQAKTVAREIRAGLAPGEDASYVVAVDDQETGETVHSSEDEPPAPSRS